MAFGLFGKRVAEVAVPAVKPKAVMPQVLEAAPPPSPSPGVGAGSTIVLREIDGPIRVRGRHWGGFRTAYKL